MSSPVVKRRALRVGLLVLACVIMSLLDLELTLMYAKEIGMVEANPIARAVMSQQSPGLVVLFKLVTVGIACGILFHLRRYRRGEVGAWLCFAILIGLSVRWLHFAANVSDYTRTYTQQAVVDPSGWVKFE